MRPTGAFEAEGKATVAPALEKGVLLGPRFIHPAWLNKVRVGQHLGQVVSTHFNSLAVELEGEILTIQGGTTAMEPWWGQVGSTVVIWLGANGYFQFCRQDDMLRHEHWHAQQAALREQEHRAALERKAQEAEAFNHSLLIPVPWQPGMKDVLSGLTEGSIGDGRNSRTVVHVLLHADLTAGRLKRQAGDFLCTSTAGGNGKRWSCDASSGRAAVTCQACLRLATRFGRNRLPTQGMDMGKSTGVNRH